jgi:hypothetical protein
MACNTSTNTYPMARYSQKVKTLNLDDFAIRGAVVLRFFVPVPAPRTLAPAYLPACLVISSSWSSFHTCQVAPPPSISIAPKNKGYFMFSITSRRQQLIKHLENWIFFVFNHHVAIFSKVEITGKPVTSDTFSNSTFSTQHSKKTWSADSASLQNKHLLSLTCRRLAKLSLVKTLPFPNNHKKICRWDLCFRP